MGDVIEYIRDLVVRNKKAKVILEYLRRNKGIQMSERTLREYMQRNGIVRYDRRINPIAVRNAILEEKASTGQNAGVQFLQMALRQRHGLLVTRRQVANICTIIDPNQRVRRLPLERRLRYCPGPNYRWCVDGYDKLKSYGIYIHGGIDEFSRRLMWLKAYVTNRKPFIVAKYYLEAVNDLGVAPDYVVSDFGHECDIISVCQQYWFRDISPNVAHHRWTYSVLNVTIESFWRRLRAMSAQYWLNEFQSLVDDGYWDGTRVDEWCLHTVYLPLINEDLDRVIEQHNGHLVRSQPSKLRPSGHPEELYEMPDQHGGKVDCGTDVSEDDVLNALISTGVNDFYLPDFVPASARIVIDDWMAVNSVRVNIENARQIYCQLRAMIYDGIS